MLPIGAAASKRLNTIIKLNKSKIIQQEKKSCGVAAPGKKHKILITGTCNLTVALQKQTIVISNYLSLNWLL